MSLSTPAALWVFRVASHTPDPFIRLYALLTFVAADLRMCHALRDATCLSVCLLVRASLLALCQTGHHLWRLRTIIVYQVGP